jgi:hypothetical protein
MISSYLGSVLAPKMVSCCSLKNSSNDLGCIL